MVLASVVNETLNILKLTILIGHSHLNISQLSHSIVQQFTYNTAIVLEYANSLEKDSH